MCATNSSGNQFAFSPVTTLTADQYIWRVDHTFSTKDTITSYGYMQRNPTNDTLPFTGATVPGFGEHATRFYKQYTAGWTHTFNSNVLNELRLAIRALTLTLLNRTTQRCPHRSDLRSIRKTRRELGCP